MFLLVFHGCSLTLGQLQPTLVFRGYSLTQTLQANQQRCYLRCSQMTTYSIRTQSPLAVSLLNRHCSLTRRHSIPLLYSEWDCLKNIHELEQCMCQRNKHQHFLNFHRTEPCMYRQRLRCNLNSRLQLEQCMFRMTL